MSLYFQLSSSVCKKKANKTSMPTDKYYVQFCTHEKTTQNMRNTNKVLTSRYSLATWAPKSLLLQFRRAANIYFLIISILTSMPFSPKQPASMIGTFGAVLVFTMFKEAYEDYFRHKSDREVNNKKTYVYNGLRFQFQWVSWKELKVGELVKVNRDQEFPADMVILKSDKESGIAFVDTMNLDGETNLKEKMANKVTNSMNEDELAQWEGVVVCDLPNEHLDKWDGNITNDLTGKTFNVKTQNLLLRGTYLRNTEYVYGIVIYSGPESKIMMNAKKPPSKVSSVMRLMNKMLYSVFIFQMALIVLFAILSVIWTGNNAERHAYLDLTKEPGFGTFFVQFLTYWVAYSHLIPISLYVVLELVKLAQAYLIKKDVEMYDPEIDQYAQCRNSDLIEEMGQVEFIFSDKTGTLTQNVMIYRQTSIMNKVYKSPDAIKSALRSKITQVEKEAIHQYLRLLAVCHTVVIDENPETGAIDFQASSPDEKALVEGAAEMGYKFVEKTNKSLKIYIEATDKYEEYEIIAEFPFDSNRKRMSLLVKDLQTGQIILLSKGADSLMYPRLQVTEDQLKVINNDLYNFACEGLRTLVMAMKVINSNQFDEWYYRYEIALTSNDGDKDEQLFELYDEMEQDLAYVGSSAIEDLLQDEVPQTIKSIMDAGVRMWVLTGDKQETAIEIGKSCNLINLNLMELFVLSSNSKEEFIRKLHEFSNKTVTKNKIAIVIDGPTLTHVLGDDILAKYFFQFGYRANSVICCRVSPKQKMDIVGLSHKNGPWITLSIGDGANDVPMIMQAHIGVGIKGKEGTQAVRSADFAITQFKHLKKMLLVHGRWGYRRVGIFICYYFYKNVILVFCELYFAFNNGFSGQIYFADWLPMLYNALWTSWPCIFTFVLERDVCSDYSMDHPILYKAGHTKHYFNFGIFWKWMIFAIWHGWACFYFPALGLQGAIDDTANPKQVWFASCISFTVIIHVVTYKLLLESNFWNKYNIMFAVISIFLYYFMVIIFNINALSVIFQPELNGVYFDMLGNPKFWMLFLVLPFICLLPDLSFKLIFGLFWKNPSDVMMMIEKHYPYQKKKRYIPVSGKETQREEPMYAPKQGKTKRLNDSLSSLAPLVEGVQKDAVANQPVDKPLYLEEVDLSKHAEPPRLGDNRSLNPPQSIHGGASARSKRSDRAKARSVKSKANSQAPHSQMPKSRDGNGDLKEEEY